MTPARIALVMMLLTAVGAVRPAAAQDAPAFDPQTPARPVVGARPAQSRIGLRAYFLADTNRMTARDTFDAVIGGSTIAARGGGGEALRLWRGIFARVAYSQIAEEGERVVIFEDEPIRLGIPLEVRMSPLEVGGGWRVDLGRARAVGVYGGGGLLRVRYRETSQFAGAGENVDETSNGYVFFGGVDVTLFRWIMLGAEAGYRSVPDAIGEGGVSAVFDEHDLGGTTLRFMIGVKR